MRLRSAPASRWTSRCAERQAVQNALDLGELRLHLLALLVLARDHARTGLGDLLADAPGVAGVLGDRGVERGQAAFLFGETVARVEAFVDEAALACDLVAQQPDLGAARVRRRLHPAQLRFEAADALLEDGEFARQCALAGDEQLALQRHRGAGARVGVGLAQCRGELDLRVAEAFGDQPGLHRAGGKPLSACDVEL